MVTISLGSCDPPSQQANIDRRTNNANNDPICSLQPREGRQPLGNTNVSQQPRTCQPLLRTNLSQPPHPHIPHMATADFKPPTHLPHPPPTTYTSHTHHWLQPTSLWATANRYCSISPISSRGILDSKSRTYLRPMSCVLFSLTHTQEHGVKANRTTPWGEMRGGRAKL